jgi:mRNA-degrading endonuclease RelE of RelBE toxin-antitoxin system
MAQYGVQFTDVALKNLRRYPKKDQRLVLARIEQLAADPQAMSNVKQLVNFDVSYRLRRVGVNITTPYGGRA